jgi:hypothetical protein
VVDRTTPSATIAGRLSAPWGADQTGTFLGWATLTVTNTGAAPLQLGSGGALRLDLYRDGKPEPIGRYSAWLAPDAPRPPLPPGAETDVDLLTTSATAACDFAVGQHVPPGAYSAVLDAPIG